MLYRSIFIMLMVGVLSGCAAMDSMVAKLQGMMFSTEVSMANPPNHPEASKVTRVAVIKGNNVSDKSIRNSVEALLSSIHVNNKPYFTVLEKNNADQVAGLHAIEKGAEFDEAAVARFGKRLGSDGVYVVTGFSSGVVDQKFSENRSKCVAKEGKKCVKYNPYKVACTKRSAHYSFTPKLVKVESMSIVYGRNIRGTNESSVCADSDKAHPTRNSLINGAKISAFDSLSKDVAPYNSVEKVIIKTGGVLHDDAKELVKAGESFAKKSRWTRACNNWDEAAGLESNSVAILYNQGLCRELSGDFRNAIQFYTQAEEFSPKPDFRISERLNASQSKLSRAEAYLD